MSASDFLNGSITNEHLPRTTPPQWDMATKKKGCGKKMTSQPTKKKKETSQPTRCKKK